MAQHRLLLYFHELLIERPDALPTAPSGGAGNLRFELFGNRYTIPLPPSREVEPRPASGSSLPLDDFQMVCRPRQHASVGPSVGQRLGLFTWDALGDSMGSSNLALSAHP